MKWKIHKKHDGIKVGDYLRTVHAFSRRMTKAIKDSGGIFVNNSLKTVNCELSAGDEVAITFPPEEKGMYMIPKKMPLSIIYEDEDILLLDKQAGIPTIPSRLHPNATVANGVLAYYAEHEIPYTVHVVTRLDRDTSGLLLIAKHRYSHSLLAALQRGGEVKRKYKAVVEGVITEKAGKIDRPIARKEGSIIERTVVETGQHAVTNYQVLRELANISLVSIELETGRTHQIRVHFSSIGHPLAGDALYGGATDHIGRHALHCDELVFPHPVTKEQMTFRLPLPDDMSQLFP